MTECDICGAKSQLRLCTAHVDELREMLFGLPRWIRFLRDTALRQTRIGSDSRIRRTRGDEMPGLFEPDAEDHRRDKPHLTKQGRAAQLLEAITNTLSTWVRHLCETRGQRVPELDLAGMARWLGAFVQSVAADEAAGECFTDIAAAIDDIEAVINRPEPRRFCGPCPTHLESASQCQRLLYARRDQIEVTCPGCHRTHNIDALARHLSARIDVLRYTAAEILVIMDAYGQPIPERTWRRWRSEDRVKVRGWKRPDNADGTRGAIGLSRHNDCDEPVYRLAEVRKCYANAIRHADALSRAL